MWFGCPRHIVIVGTPVSQPPREETKTTETPIIKRKDDIWVAGINTVDTTGRVTLAGFKRGTAGYVLEAQGASTDPMYVEPDGRYTPTAHENGHANLYPSGGSDTGQVGNTTTYWNVMATNSLWNKAQSGFACDPKNN